MSFSKRSPFLRCIFWMTVTTACILANAVWAQVVPSATRPSHSLWLGGEYSNVEASFPYASNQRLSGIGAFADYSLTSHFAVEGEARFLRFNSFYGESEDNYLGGPLYVARRFGKFQPHAKCLVGIGKIQFPFNIGSESYFAVVPGAGVSYRISRRWALRGEYEYQFWLNSPNVVNEPAHEITPNGFHVGVAFRLFR